MLGRRAQAHESDMSFFKSLFEDETHFDFNHDDAPNYDGGTRDNRVNGPGKGRAQGNFATYRLLRCAH